MSKIFMMAVVVSFLFTYFHNFHAEEKSSQELEVTVEGIRAVKGEIGVAVFNGRTGFPIHLEHSYEVEWVPLQSGQERIRVVFDSLPPGDYAVSVLHDENGNRKLERSTLGFPKEGVGFSNDQTVKLSAPKFDQCKFSFLKGEKKTITTRLEYR